MGLEFLRHREVVSGAILFVTAREHDAWVDRDILRNEWLIGEVEDLKVDANTLKWTIVPLIADLKVNNRFVLSLRPAQAAIEVLDFR